MAAGTFLGPGINAARKRANQPEVMHIQLSYCNSCAPINNVEVKNIKSDSSVAFTQLQKTWLQHLDDM